MIDINKLSESVPRSGDEYVAEDGLLHCKKCGDPLECIINPLRMGERKVRCICSCSQKKKDVEDAEQRKIMIERNRRLCFAGSDLMGCTFNNSSDTEYIRIAKNYTEHFSEFLKKKKGLLLYGPVGTGKSHMAACIANRLIDEGYMVMMTNFASIVNKLQNSFEGRQEYIDKLTNYALLVLDDLGTERRSEYMQEQVFNIVDARYRSGKPMIITTNLTADQMKKPSDIGQGRIYDRILERCHPVEVKGQSIRRASLKNDYWDTERMLKGE